jgi:hypothetical protein
MGTPEAIAESFCQTLAQAFGQGGAGLATLGSLYSDGSAGAASVLCLDGTAYPTLPAIADLYRQRVRAAARRRGRSFAPGRAQLLATLARARCHVRPCVLVCPLLFCAPRSSPRAPSKSASSRGQARSTRPRASAWCCACGARRACARAAPSHPPLRVLLRARACRLLLLATGESSFPAGRFSALYVLEQTAAGAMFVRAEVLRFGAGAR